jgi:hypothetical protein
MVPCKPSAKRPQRATENRPRTAEELDDMKITLWLSYPLRLSVGYQAAKKKLLLF